MVCCAASVSATLEMKLSVVRAAPARIAGPAPLLWRPASPRPRSAPPVRAAGPGGGVIDRPTTAPDITRRRETRRRRPPSYRVLLHNDNVNKREYVVQVLLRVVEGYTVEDALNVMQEAHIHGMALVTVCAQDQAENICEGMRASGLVSTMEPAGPGGV